MDDLRPRVAIFLGLRLVFRSGRLHDIAKGEKGRRVGVSISKQQRTAQTDWVAGGRTCGMGRGDDFLLLSKILASLPVAASVACCRVPDFVGGHLTWIMITASNS